MYYFYIVNTLLVDTIIIVHKIVAAIVGVVGECYYQKHWELSAPGS